MKKRIALLVLLSLTGCCMDGTESDCTDADRQRIAEQAVPVLVAERDGVRLWRIRDRGDNVWFTTPCGEASWTESRRTGKATRHIPHQTNGQGCEP